MKNELLFNIWPYAAALVFSLGLAGRAGSVSVSGPAATGDLTGQRRLWHYSLLLMFLGHLVGLLFPHQVLAWDNVMLRLYPLEGLAFAAGLLTLAGCTGLLWRHLKSADEPATAQVADFVFLALLFVTISSGLLTAALYRWGSSWGVLTLTPYAISVLHGRPTTGLVTEMPFFVRLHVFSSVTLLAVLPFSRVASPLLFVLRTAVTLAAGACSAVIDFGRRIAQDLARKHNPSLWIWPEED